MKAYEVTAMTLAQYGVDTVFSVPGDGNLLIDYELSEVHGAMCVKAVREDGAVMMADGFTRASGRLGAASVTLGPGLTNSITAITTAVRNHTPMVIITGEKPQREKGHFQEIDQMALLHPTGVAIKRIIRHDRVAEDVGEAIRSALSESRPTVISLPLDLQRQDVGHQEPAWEPLPQGSWIPSPDSLDSAVGVIASSRRPVILAGRGAFKSGARDPLLRLAERIGAPVGTTLLNKDFFAGDPCNVGVIGTLASSVAGAVVQEADCLIVFGASLDEHTTASGSLTSDKAVVHCDTDPAAIGRHLSVTAGLVGDAAATANAICDWLDELDHEPSIGRNLDLQAALDRVNRTRQEYAASADHLNMRVFSTLLNDILPREKSFTLDAGRFFRAPVQSLNVPDPSAFLWTASFGSVGLGLATGIGGAVGRPGRPMVVVAGDGGLMMSLSELSTAVRYGLDIILVVLNDGAYGAEYRLLVNHDKDPRFSMFQWPDFARLAEAFGASGIVVTDLKDMPLVEQTISKRQGPVVIDVRCDPADPLGQWPEGAQ